VSEYAAAGADLIEVDVITSAAAATDIDLKVRPI